jgi:hypothetical protein
MSRWRGPAGMRSCRRGLDHRDHQRSSIGSGKHGNRGAHAAQTFLAAAGIAGNRHPARAATGRRPKARIWMARCLRFATPAAPDQERPRRHPKAGRGPDSPDCVGALVLGKGRYFHQGGSLPHRPLRSRDWNTAGNRPPPSTPIVPFQARPGDGQRSKLFISEEVGLSTAPLNGSG